MPVTPFHVGPGSLVKAALREKFSLTIFAFAQVMIDLQPLAVMLGADLKLHGFSHTYIGATLVALISSVIGKPLCEFCLGYWNTHLSLTSPVWHFPEKISWPVVISSALLGTYSHLLLDCLMHAEIEPFYPLPIHNQLFDLIDAVRLHELCIYAGLFGFIGYFVISYLQHKT